MFSGYHGDFWISPCKWEFGNLVFEKKKRIVCSFYPGKLVLCWQITFWQLGRNLKHAFSETMNNKVYPGIDSYFSFIFLYNFFQWIQEINWSAKYLLYFLNNSEIYPHIKKLTYVNLILVIVKNGIRKEHKLLNQSDLKLNLDSVMYQLCDLGQVF